MKYKIGDKVNFLNEHGGGVVCKVVSSNLVYVRIEDGFEIPTMTAELVKVVDSTQQAGDMFVDKFTADNFAERGHSEEKEVEEEVVFDDRTSPLDIFRAKGNDKNGVYLLYFKDLSSKILAPVNAIFSFKPTKFYRENIYQDSTFISDKAFLLILNEINTQAAVAESELGEKYDEEIKLENAKPKKPEEVINKHKTSPRDAVVDLHIGELVDDYSKMSSAEMLNYQLNYFVRCLESAIRAYLTKVTFIHGVGEGVLKSKMKDIINEYDNVKTQDASLKNFGYGATELLIWHSNFA
ncbi:MAG: hypothetical protein B6I19_01745 [Bacteroidetes bacterium 4572_114]|nr:MAG: hypothetical protein B6I19_01745 [Bacteroidetes bacterium 4572_114]